MSYQALYRQYRPKCFEDVIGQEHIVTTLINQINSGHIGHAYLFTGSRGVGKTTCARIFARAINCLRPVNGSPCGKCEVCKAYDENNMDIIEIDAASNNKVEEVRDIREKVKYPPINGKYKVYIIDEVHMLTDSAFNALLKTLEEPPAHAVFILATTEAHKLPATILSRCMRFDFRLVTTEDIIKLLKKIFDKNKIEYDDKSVQAIATAAEGGVRDALSISDCAISFGKGKIDYDTVVNILGIGDKEQVATLVDNIIKGDLGEVLENINSAYLSGKNFAVFGKELTNYFKNLIVVKTCNNPDAILNQPKEIMDRYKLQADKISVDKLLAFMEKFSNIETDLKYSLSPKTLIELTCLECASFDPSKKF